MDKVRIVIADDERPAREFLKNILREFDDAAIVGEAADGKQAVEIIAEKKPDLALIDLQMPEMNGLDVAAALGRDQMPSIAFVTAYDEYAVRAFEVGAVDYLLKPVEKSRLRETLDRAKEKLKTGQRQTGEADKISRAAQAYNDHAPADFIRHIPVKKRDEIFLVPVSDVASIVADGELLHITTIENQRFVINFRLKDLEARLDPDKFVRLSRGSLVNLSSIEKILPMPGGIYQIMLKNAQELTASRIQSRILRDKLLKL